MKQYSVIAARREISLDTHLGSGLGCPLRPVQHPPLHLIPEASFGNFRGWYLIASTAKVQQGKEKWEWIVVNDSVRGEERRFLNEN
jgi:hypothetical protein